MKFNDDYLLNYLSSAPLPLAIERGMECEIFSHQNISYPILDLGCGDGLFTLNLFVDKVKTGIDPNSNELQRAKISGLYNELINCYGDFIPKERNCYNTIISNSVLEHIPDLQPVLKEVYRLLTDDGHFFVTLPTDKFDQYSIFNQVLLKLRLNETAQKYRFIFNKFWRHYHYYSPDEWKKIFNQAGFEVVDEIEYGTKQICLLDDFLVLFSGFSFLTKKILNRWILFPNFRRRYMRCISFFLKKIIRQSIYIKNGGLIFLNLKKTKENRVLS